MTDTIKPPFGPQDLTAGQPQTIDLSQQPYNPPPETEISNSSPLSEPPPPDSPAGLPSFYSTQPSSSTVLTSNQDPPDLRKGKGGHNLLGFVLGLIMGSAVILGVGYWYFIIQGNPLPDLPNPFGQEETNSPQQPTNEKPISTPVSQPISRPLSDGIDIGNDNDNPTDQNRYLAFVRAGNIVILSSATQIETNVTDDGTIAGTNYTHPTWKNATTLTYVKCTTETKCDEIYTYQPSTHTSSLLYTLENDVMIISLDWSDDENSLGVIVRDQEGTYGAEVYTKNGAMISLGNYQPGAGRGGTFSDQIDIRFSPDSEVVAVVNTTLSPSEDPDTTPATFYLYTTDGDPLAEILGATFPIFIDADTLAFVREDKLFKYVVSTAKETEFALFAGYNPVLSPDGTTLAYWKLDNSIPTLFTYDLSTQASKKIIANFSQPQWIDDTTLIAEKDKTCTGCMVGFEANGIATVTLADQTWSNVITDVVYEFSLSPFAE
jgi:hypothetical protein